MFSNERRIIFPAESTPAPINEILSRFANETVREERFDATAELRARSFIWSKVLDSFGTEFELENFLSSCPQKELVVAGALLTGRTNPTDLERLEKIFCGQTIEPKDTFGELGPLSGKRGNELVPISQCWVITQELVELVEFMKQVETAPLLEECRDEESLRLLLGERSRVNKRLEMRGIVAVVWDDLLQKRTDSPSESLLLATGEVVKEPEVELGLQKKVFDPSLQFDVYKDRYTSLVARVEEVFLQPLVTLVGENMQTDKSLPDGKILLNLGFETTAEKCPKKPRREFHGEIS